MRKQEILNNVDAMENQILIDNQKTAIKNELLSMLKVEGRRVREGHLITPDAHTTEVITVAFRKKEGTLVEKLRGINHLKPIFPVRQIQMKDHLPKGEAAKGWVLSQVAELLSVKENPDFDETEKSVKDVLRKISREKKLFLTVMVYYGLNSMVEHVRLYDFAEEAKPYDKVHNKLFDEAVAELEAVLSPDKTVREVIRYKVLDE